MPRQRTSSYFFAAAAGEGPEAKIEVKKQPETKENVSDRLLPFRNILYLRGFVSLPLSHAALKRRLQSF